MSDSFLDKYVRRTTSPQPTPHHDGEVIDRPSRAEHRHESRSSLQESDASPETHDAPPAASSSLLDVLGDTGEAATDFGCFGWYRGVRERALMLELRKKDGHIMALGYAWIERMEFDPTQGITLYAPGQRIRITGSGLNAETKPSIRLYDGLIRHRVPWIQECDRNESMHASGNAAIIERITWDG